MRDSLRDKLCLEHIIDACDRIASYYPIDNVPVLDIKSIEFFGLVKNLEIIGEASYKLTKDFIQNHPETNWRQIIGMRHIMVHGYYNVKPIVVKQIIESEIANLRRQVDIYLEEFCED